MRIYWEKKNDKIQGKLTPVLLDRLARRRGIIKTNTREINLATQLVIHA
jgi:hypothetical protein